MRQRMPALLLFLALSCPALAQDGGKLPWRGKGGEDPKAVFAEARSKGLPTLLYFTSEG